MLDCDHANCVAETLKDALNGMDINLDKKWFVIISFWVIVIYDWTSLFYSKYIILEQTPLIKPISMLLRIDWLAI